MQETTRLAREWRKNITHIEWLAGHLDLYDFPEEQKDLGQKLEYYTERKFTYYSRAVEIYEELCSKLFSNPFKYQYGLVEKKAGMILCHDIRGYMVNVGGSYFPFGFLWENKSCTAEIEDAFKAWKDQLDQEYLGLENYQKAWSAHMGRSRRRILQAEPKELASRAKGLAALLCNGMTGAVLWSFWKPAWEKSGESPVLPIAACTLAAVAVWGAARGIWEIYLAEKIRIMRLEFKTAGEMELLLQEQKKKALGISLRDWIANTKLQMEDSTQMVAEFMRLCGNRFTLYEKELRVLKGRLPVVAGAVAWIGAQMLFYYGMT